jgi:hypothetical protein
MAEVISLDEFDALLASMPVGERVSQRKLQRDSNIADATDDGWLVVTPEYHADGNTLEPMSVRQGYVDRIKATGNVGAVEVFPSALVKATGKVGIKRVA